MGTGVNTVDGSWNRVSIPRLSHLLVRNLSVRSAGNSSFLGGRDKEHQRSRPAKISKTLISTNKPWEGGGGEGGTGEERKNIRGV
jgi:hypothetical protein